MKCLHRDPCTIDIARIPEILHMKKMGNIFLKNISIVICYYYGIVIK